jgi:hypothetical protein
MPSDPRNYPPNWRELKVQVRARAGSVCECMGECGLHHGHRCVEVHQKPARHFAGLTALATAHCCNDGPACPKLGHLKALCQRCHLRLDAQLHWKHRRQREKDILNCKIKPPSPLDPPTSTEG